MPGRRIFIRVGSLKEVNICPDGVGLWLLVQVPNRLPVAVRVHLEQRLMHVVLFEIALCLREFIFEFLVLFLKEVFLTLEALDLGYYGLQLILLLQLLLLYQPQLLLAVDGLLLEGGDPLEGTLPLVATPVHEGLAGDLHDGRLH